MQESALYVNAQIYTMDPERPKAAAILIQGDRITALGSREEVTAPGVRTVDLGGRTVIPGFNDCHCHILSFGLELDRLDVGPDAVRDIEDIKAVVARRAERMALGDWVLGRGYDQNSLRERRHPTRTDLDAAEGARPVVLWHTSGHALACNSRALALAGITRDTVTPSGGEIERGDHGEPSGVLKESAMDLLEDSLPVPRVEQGAEAILRGMRAMARQGITSASDAATGQGQSIEPALRMYRNALNSGHLAGRITLMPQITCVASPDSGEVHVPEEFAVGDQPAWLRIGATKIFSDGALTTRTAALREPFEGSGSNRGILIWDTPILAGMICRAHEAGWQIGTHAIGDRAIEVVLDCYAQALHANPRPDHRHRIEHCMLLDEGLGRRIRDMGVIPTIQPGFVSRLGDAYIAAIGMDRAAQLMPMRLFEHLSIPAAFSSDRPVIPGAPLQGVLAAVRRQSPGGVVLGREHSIPALEAIRLYTAGAAYATRVEQTRGSLRPGMLADLTVLSHDPAALSPEDLDALSVTMTVAGGRETYSE